MRLLRWDADRLLLFGAGILLGYLASFISFDTATSSQPPSRPAGVPQDAYWAGGIDGGQFYRCRIKPELFCMIYNDQSGTVEKSGVITLSPWQRERYQSIGSFYADIDAYDGRSLHLVTRASLPFALD